MDYKKMMTVAGALICASAMADVVSSSVVGYLNKPATEAGLRYVTPAFGQVDDSANTVQDLQMDSSVATAGANIQFLDRNGISTVQYVWITKTTAAAYNLSVPTGANGIWAKMTSYYDEDEEMDIISYSAVEEGDLEIGQAVVLQLEGAASATITTKGQVLDTEPTLTNPAAGLMYVGNPFAASISINDFQMDSSVATAGANIQLLDKNGISTAQYVWLPSSTATDYSISVPEGRIGVWAIMSSYYDEEEELDIISYTAADVTIGPGDGVQLESAAGAKVKILAPYSL